MPAGVFWLRFAKTKAEEGFNQGNAFAKTPFPIPPSQYSLIAHDSQITSRPLLQKLPGSRPSLTTQAASDKSWYMRKLLALLPTLPLISILTASLALAERTDEHKMHETPPDISSPELNRIKALEGRWTSTTSMFGKKDEQVFTEYAITAGGSTVVETIFPGTPNEMVSVYYDNDQGKLAMTHYCMMRNRPHFTLVESGKDKIKLDVTKVEGLKSKDDPSMGAITINFEDKDHFSSTCEGRGKTDKDHGPMTMRYTRVK